MLSSEGGVVRKWRATSRLTVPRPVHLRIVVPRVTYMHVLYCQPCRPWRAPLGRAATSLCGRAHGCAKCMQPGTMCFLCCPPPPPPPRSGVLPPAGQIFQAVVAAESAAPADARKQMEEAMFKVVEKRAQQEAAGAVNDDD